jgi:hypothetical protein
MSANFSQSFSLCHLSAACQLSKKRRAQRSPELAEGRLEQVGDVEPLVGAEQSPQRLVALQGEVLLARQQFVFLALDMKRLSFPDRCA